MPSPLEKTDYKAVPNSLGRKDETPHKRVKKHERSVAKAIGGKCHVMSGAGHFQKCDASSFEILAEAKMTSKKSFSVTLEILDKLCSHAFTTGKTPVLSIRFENAEFPTKKDWMLMPMDKFEELVGK